MKLGSASVDGLELGEMTVEHTYNLGELLELNVSTGKSKWGKLNIPDRQACLSCSELPRHR